MFLKTIKRAAFKKSLRNTTFFRRYVRPGAYLISRWDPERVHELSLDVLNEFEDILEEASHNFQFPRLQINLAGHTISPFGTAAGLDKNGDALYPLSQIFGFLKPGTVVVNPREGNAHPRVAVDNLNQTIYNAQGFPSKGLEYFLGNVREFRDRNDTTPLFVSVCGIPPDHQGLNIAYQELETLLDEINPYADGFVWNPFSPNTEALSLLRTPEEFRRNAELVSNKAGDKLKLVKMGPYDREKKTRMARSN